MDEMNYFKQSFKYFKKRHNPEIMNSVLNMEAHSIPECATLLEGFGCENIVDKCTTCTNLGLKSHHEWHVYKFEGFSGFFYIRNPFITNAQQLWIRKCLAQYTRKPSVTNLDRHYDDLDDIWSLYRDGKCTFIDKLTWVTLGYHYNWDEKVYDRRHFSSFPKCLADLAKHIASCLNFKTFEPDTAIINYYNTKSTLGIHNDHSEEELNEPIVSISFGLTAIFLMGTENIEEKPLPLFLKSGDIVLLSGQSRLAYHAVPSIIQDCDWTCDEEDNCWKLFGNYMKQHRINVSVRQVYPASN